MQEKHGELLKIACDRIGDLERPAYIKNSELRYVAVNDAYARFLGRKTTDFPGLRNTDLLAHNEDLDLEDKERRALVFGTEEAGICFDPFGPNHYRVAVERFIPDDETAFIFGFFDDKPDATIARNIEKDAGPLPAPGAFEGHIFDGSVLAADLDTIREQLEDVAYPIGIFSGDGRPLVANAAFRRKDTVRATAPAQSGKDGAPPARDLKQIGEDELDAIKVSVENSLELLDVGIAIFGRNDQLLYRNARLQDIYGPAIGELEIGLPLKTLFERIYDHGVEHVPEIIRRTPPVRDLWIGERLELAAAAYNDSIEQTCNGAWLRCINRRLDNGLLLMLRIDVSDLKEQELLLRKHIKETELYRSVIEELPVATFVRDSGHRLTFVNQVYADLMGMTREEMLDTVEKDIFGPYGEEIHQENLTILRTGKVAEKNEELIRKDGQPVPVITRVARVQTSGGELFLVGSISNVSVLKTREKQLIKAQRQAESLHRDLDSILRSLPAGVLILSDTFDIEFANAALYDIWDWPPARPLEGWPLREVMKVSFDRGWYADYGDDFDDAYRRRTEELRIQHMIEQHEVNLPNGKALIITGRLLSDGRILITYLDISAMRLQEREIHEARDQLERIGQVMQDATRVMAQGLLVIEDRVIVLSNEAAARILHIPDELVTPGRSWEDIFDYCAARGDFGSKPESVKKLWWRAAEDKQPICAAFTTAGTTWVQIEGTVSGRGHWTVVLNDLTEMKHREEELKGLLARSEAADRAKSEFLANMSHEIRTPMNGVLGMAELLAKTDLDTRQKTFIDIIVKSANALLTIINDILDFSKIDAGQMTLKKAPFDPVDAVEDVATLLSSSAAQKDIELMIRSAGSLPQTVVGDAGRFRQIVTNLVGNAVKFTEKGHILIDVSGEPDANGTFMLSVRVEDTGIGIPPEKLQSIFEKFSQVDASSTRRHEGTGLGLAITAGLVGLFGGYVEVDSDLGHGSVFTVHLPMALTGSATAPRPVPVNVRGAHILVIDDNDVSRTILCEQLELWGFDGFAAESGQAGIAILETAAGMGVKVDAVILDYHMPDMNGADVVRRLRGDRRFDDTAIIFLTSMDVAGDDSIFSTLNVQAHFMKPARANVLRNTIIEVVRANRARRMGYGAAVHSGQPSPASPGNAAGTDEQTPDAPQWTPLSSGPQDPDRHCDVLVAEDNEVNCIVFSQILQATNLRFLIVNNGQEAIEAYEAYRPGIILMDVSMPVMNGYQATRTIREREAAAGSSHVPIIGVTAHALESDRNLCFESGMDDYLAKPVSPELLEAKIGRWLKRPVTASRETS